MLASMLGGPAARAQAAGGTRPLAGSDSEPAAAPPPPRLDSQPSAPDAELAPLPPPPPRREASLKLGGAAPGNGSAVVPDSAPEAAGAFYHDGFYLRFALGGAFGRTSVRTDRVSKPDVSLGGLGGAFDVWCGWSLARGVIVGPALSISSSRTDTARITGRVNASASATTAELGAFVDAYPNPRRGEHFGGLLALSSIKETTADGDDATDVDAAGVGFAVFAGYDAWIAREWSLGALLRAGGIVARTTQTIGDEDVEKLATSYGAALLVTLVYQ